MRFVAADDSWLSPAFERHSGYLGVYHAGRSGWRAYQQAVETRFHDFEARPHWGKTFSTTRETLATRYPRYFDFVRLRRELDPGGLFLNPLLHRLFS